MPIVDPGGRPASAIVPGCLGDRVRLRPPPGVEAFGERRVAERDDLRRQQAGIGRARLADRQRADGDARRLRVKAVGPRMSVFVDGEGPLIEAEDSAHALGRVGLQANDVNARFGGFRVAPR